MTTHKSKSRRPPVNSATSPQCYRLVVKRGRGRNDEARRQILKEPNKAAVGSSQGADGGLARLTFRHAATLQRQQPCCKTPGNEYGKKAEM